jgi:ribulose-phosphate 3-epimerase|nr:ribulose-phosphate 3-epimerase [Salinisphaera sp.]
MKYVLDKIDIVQIMSVNPGFGGQSFIHESLAKIAEAREIIDSVAEASGREIRLEVDGGVKIDNIRQIADAGCDTFVAGSAIFGQPDYVEVIRQMRAQIG